MNNIVVINDTEKEYSISHDVLTWIKTESVTFAMSACAGKRIYSHALAMIKLRDCRGGIVVKFEVDLSRKLDTMVYLNHFDHMAIDPD